MRTRLFALAALASVLLVASARAGEDGDPFADTEPKPAGELPPLPALADLPPLPDLVPLPALPPLGTTRTHAPALALAPASALAPAPAPVAPAMLSLPAVTSATLGQYDEYKRALAAFSIDADPVSASSFQRCVAAGQCTKPSCAAAHGADGRVTCVDLAQAKSYCAFAGERLPSEEEWEHAARQASTLAMHATDDAAEWTSSPYCFFCGKDDQVVRGGPARNPALRGWRPPATHDAGVGFRCAK
jgi:formylglycine-generating enzyme required for sulfatase activity